MSIKIAEHINYSVLGLISDYCAPAQVALNATYRTELEAALPFTQLDAMIHASNSLAVCHKVAELISGYCEEDNTTDCLRDRMVAKSCRGIWSRFISGESYIQTLFHDHRIEFQQLNNPQEIYEALVRLASSDFTKEFLTKLFDSFQRYGCILTFRTGTSSYAHYEPAKDVGKPGYQPPRAYVTIGPITRAIYEYPDKRWYYKPMTLDEMVRHELTHHYHQHYNAPTETFDFFWTTQDEEQVIGGINPKNGTIERYSDRAFAEAEGSPIRLGHRAVNLKDTESRVFQCSLIVGVDGEAIRLINSSEHRAYKIIDATKALTFREVYNLVKSGETEGCQTALRPFLCPFEKMFNVSAKPPEFYTRTFAIIDTATLKPHWRQQIRLRQAHIRKKLEPALVLGNSVKSGPIMEHLKKRMFETGFLVRILSKGLFLRSLLCISQFIDLIFKRIARCASFGHFITERNEPIFPRKLKALSDRVVAAAQPIMSMLASLFRSHRQIERNKIIQPPIFHHDLNFTNGLKALTDPIFAMYRGGRSFVISFFKSEQNNPQNKKDIPNNQVPLKSNNNNTQLNNNAQINEK